MPTVQKPLSPQQLDVPTTDQISVGTAVWLYCVKAGEWKQGVIKVIDDRFDKPEYWQVGLNNGTKLTARSLDP